MKNLLITGGNGFLGIDLVSEFSKKKNFYVSSIVKELKTKINNVKFIELNFSSRTNWDNYTENIDVVIHTAALVHQSMSKNLKENYIDINFKSVKNLFLSCKKNKVKKFIFISTIAVNGELNIDHRKFRYDDIPNPLNIYSISKNKAEEYLKEHFNCQTEIIIIRTPLIYGPGVKSNFLTLLKMIDKQIPLPFGDMKINKKSYLFVKNLTNFIEIIIGNKLRNDGIYLISDDHDISTKDLVKMISSKMNRKSLLFPLPINIFYILSKMFMLHKLYIKLAENLQLDIERTKTNFSWRPPYSMEEGIDHTVKWYLDRK